MEENNNQPIVFESELTAPASEPAPVGDTAQSVTETPISNEQAKKKSKIPLVIILVILLIAGGVAAYLFLFKDKSDDKAADKKFTCGNNDISIFYDKDGSKTSLKAVLLNDIDITKTINDRENKNADSLENVDVICSSEFFIIKLAFSDIAGEEFDKFFRVYDYKGNELYRPESETDQTFRDEPFILSTESDVTLDDDVIAYKVRNQNRDNGEIAFYNYGEDGENLTCKEYEELKNDLITYKMYEIKYLGNSKFSEKKIVSYSDLERDFNPSTGSTIDYRPDGCVGLNSNGSCDNLLNLTKSKTDNAQLYSLCVKELDEVGFGFVIDSVIESADKLTKGFPFDSKKLTNKEGDDIEGFANAYAVAYVNAGLGYTIRTYLNTMGTCINKDVMNSVSEELYGSDELIRQFSSSQNNRNSFIRVSDNYICFPDGGIGTELGVREDLNKKEGNSWLFRYKVVEPNGSEKEDFRISLNLKDGYWKIDPFIKFAEN